MPIRYIYFIEQYLQLVYFIYQAVRVICIYMGEMFFPLHYILYTQRVGSGVDQVYIKHE